MSNVISSVFRRARVVVFALGVWSALSACNETPASPGLLPPETEFGSGGLLTTGGNLAVTTGGVGQSGGYEFAPPGGNLELGSGGAVGGGGQLTTGGIVGGEDLFCAALDAVRRNCQNCHGEQPAAGAPMPLVTYEDMIAQSVLNPSRSVPELLSERIYQANRPMPPPPAEMSELDKVAIDRWVAAGRPPSTDPTCGAATGTGGSMDGTGGHMETPEWPEDCEEVVRLTTSSKTNPGQAYIVRANTEEHPQFIFDAPWGDDPVQIVAERPIVDNAKVLHHWILYQNSGGRSSKFIVGWAPGKQTRGQLPEDVGIYVPSGPRSLRLDMHYYNLGNDQDEPDESGVELCITRKFRKHTATVMGLTGNATVPPNSKVDNVSRCSAVASEESHFLTVSPHMHKYGRNGKLELTRDGTTTVLHDKPFDFEDQQVWDLNDVEIKTGDVLTTTCSYENNTSNRITFGENSDDEMCFNFVLYYPMGALTCGFTI